MASAVYAKLNFLVLLFTFTVYYSCICPLSLPTCPDNPKDPLTDISSLDALKTKPGFEKEFNGYEFVSYIDVASTAIVIKAKKNNKQVAMKIAQCDKLAEEASRHKRMNAAFPEITAKLYTYKRSDVEKFDFIEMELVGASIGSLIGGHESNGYSKPMLRNLIRHAVKLMTELHGGPKYDGSTPCWAHGDYHLGNVVLSHDKKSLKLIDFATSVQCDQRLGGTISGRQNALRRDIAGFVMQLAECTFTDPSMFSTSNTCSWKQLQLYTGKDLKTDFVELESKYWLGPYPMKNSDLKRWDMELKGLINKYTPEPEDAFTALAL